MGIRDQLSFLDYDTIGGRERSKKPFPIISSIPHCYWESGAAAEQQCNENIFIPRWCWYQIPRSPSSSSSLRSIEGSICWNTKMESSRGFGIGAPKWVPAVFAASINCSRFIFWRGAPLRRSSSLPFKCNEIPICSLPVFRKRSFRRSSKQVWFVESWINSRWGGEQELFSRERKKEDRPVLGNRSHQCLVIVVIDPFLP